jgi:hypothetical protein
MNNQQTFCRVVAIDLHGTTISYGAAPAAKNLTYLPDLSPLERLYVPCPGVQQVAQRLLNLIAPSASAEPAPEGRL